MLCYGRLDDILRTIQREIELLSTLLNRDKKLDNYIKRKIDLLNICINNIKRLPPGEYQIVAINSCEIIPL
ncbi:hypothetical protein [Pyrobaculum aerophilum]|uniref:Uncharacterized protein n=1 Tax=Pyrobaculum aerophilum TaxID=13773 RepID=A0A371R1L1_9CREN|nr:hypothetical protein [Pyrobaculum aerophilum]RFA97438.1 hypothetical protein CGL51_03060 [Pyrobaculum aerophilum]RFA97501.1 hypothetical protein CGL52_09245 [Pyrobaculum aerophilum]